MQLGLIGKSLTHSFSQRYFQEKFANNGLDNYSYENFELAQIHDFPALLEKHPQLRGLNVTIPYKEAIIPFLDELSPEARAIGAVNTLSLKGDLKRGYNTDQYGFCESLKPQLQENHTRALILGTGGDSRAVSYALKKLNINYILVSRHPTGQQVSYAWAGEQLKNYPLVINTTPLGTYPATEEIAPLKMDHVSENHLFYDLIYNPGITKFLAQARALGAQVKNGEDMLQLQAQKAWQIWHDV